MPNRLNFIKEEESPKVGIIIDFVTNRHQAWLEYLYNIKGITKTAKGDKPVMFRSWKALLLEVGV